MTSLRESAVSTPPPVRMPKYEKVVRGNFDPARHYYPRVLNAQIHSMVRYFFTLDNRRIVNRYCHLNPKVDPEVLSGILSYVPKYFRWAGSDLFHVTTAGGVRHMVVVETNSCPSGQKSMPLYEEHDEFGGYRSLLERSFMPLLRNRRLPSGELAVIYDKNYMEASGYAAAMAELFGEPVHLVEFPDRASEQRVRFDEGVLCVRDVNETWVPIRCAFRYVTQRPWSRIPVHTKTVILNPIFACLAGGRNKMVAAKAYDFYNAELHDTGLKLHTPETIWDVHLNEVSLWVRKLGGIAVVKVPYSNAGQGVYTITSPEELEAFLGLEHRYERFIVQSLIGHYAWSSTSAKGRLYHVGTVPNKKGHTYVADLRMMVSAGEEGFRPHAIYARRAANPLTSSVGDDSWSVLGTNLSIKRSDGGWDSDTDRLLLMDRKDFNTLGIGLDDLIEAFIQSVLATIAIDKTAQNLTNKKGQLKMKLFRSLNDDPALLGEVTP